MGFFDSLFGGGSSGGSSSGGGGLVGGVVELIGGALNALAGSGVFDKDAKHAPYAGTESTSALERLMGNPSGGAKVSKPGTLGSKNMANIGGLGLNFGNLLDLAAGAASFVGALKHNQASQKQQKALQAQQAARYKNFVGEHVDYAGMMPNNVYGNAPTQATTMMGFDPEQKLVSKYAQGGLTQARMFPQGEVNGPGTGRSDSIPAYLSDGEFVIPADVVDKVGPDYFHNQMRQIRGGALNAVRGRNGK